MGQSYGDRPVTRPGPLPLPLTLFFAPLPQTVDFLDQKLQKQPKHSLHCHKALRGLCRIKLKIAETYIQRQNRRTLNSYDRTTATALALSLTLPYPISLFEEPRALPSTKDQWTDPG